MGDEIQKYPELITRQTRSRRSEKVVWGPWRSRRWGWLEVGSLWRLTKLDVFLHEHDTSQFLQYGFNCVVPVPSSKNWNGSSINLTGWRYAAHIDPWGESHCGRLLWIRITTLKPQAVHPILEGGPWRSNNHPGPVLQIDIIFILQSPTRNIQTYSQLIIILPV